jgi:SAM-dependent methyltransferase
MVKLVLRAPLLKRRVSRHMAALGSGGEMRVVFGRHWAELPGWLILSQEEQDITKPLGFRSGSVDAVFTEHVIEHVDFAGGVAFMREALRVLKPGGVFRAVCPVTEKLLSFTPTGERDREYLRCLERYYPAEKEVLKGLKFDGLAEFPQVFLLNSVYAGYGHKFIWSAELLARVLSALGYASARVYEIGNGIKPEYCVERRRRGIYLGGDPAEDRSAGYVYDAESLAVEAVK